MSKFSRFLLCTFFLSLALVPAHAAFAKAPVPSNPQIECRLDAILKPRARAQKIDYIGGAGFAVRVMPARGIPALEMSDGRLGVRSQRKFPSPPYAAGIGRAASWDPQLAEPVDAGIRDARARVADTPALPACRDFS